MTTSLARRAEQAAAAAEAASQRGAPAEASAMQQASLPFELTATAYRRCARRPRRLGRAA
jgi:hypothetical protein